MSFIELKFFSDEIAAALIVNTMSISGTTGLAKEKGNVVIE
jgi:hypothetical protein